jgi:hypothetical protein
MIVVITLKESNTGPITRSKPLLLIIRTPYLGAPHQRDHVLAKTWMNKMGDREQWAVTTVWGLVLFGRDRGRL